jgi:hypothetical protein
MPGAEGPEPEPPGRSFRLGVWLAVAGVIALGVGTVLRRQPSTVDAELTLITSDRHEVACSSARTFGSYACGFDEAGHSREVKESDTLRPYMTVDRRVYLIRGLFLQPNLERRYQAEPANRAPEQLRRFTARCKLKKLGYLEGFKLRWAEKGAWSEPQTADVVTAEACEVAG